MNSKIVVIGGGPCGLGACSRLQQMKHKNWTLIDKNNYTGGLAGSFLDSKKFLWDVGVHINFSHYKYYDDLIDQGVLSYVKNFQGEEHHEMKAEDIGNLDNLWMTHKRECWIKFRPDEWISYPFQNNFFNTKDEQVVQDCMLGMLDLYKTNSKSKPANFQELIDNYFGSGLAKHFMTPYNFKVWGYPVNEMNANWVGERVSMVDMSKILSDYIKFSSSDKSQPKKEVGGWGPNSTFKYPKYGGTGSVWKGVGRLLDSSNLRLNTEIVEIDTDKKQIKLDNSESIDYDYIVSTMPIDILIKKIIKPTKRLNVEQIFSKYGVPKHSTTHVVCLGFDGPMPQDLQNKSWMYFQSDLSPFYRLTAFSSYSPYLVDKPGKQSSIMVEVCETINMPDRSNIIEKVIDGALNEKILTELDVDRIVDKYLMKFDYGYPTPYLNRDPFLNEVEPILRNDLGIYSRGRFGGWKYEVANQDHSCMQGVEAVDNILFGCEEQTFHFPDHVNNRKETTRRFNL